LVVVGSLVVVVGLLVVVVGLLVVVVGLLVVVVGLLVVAFGLVVVAAEYTKELALIVISKIRILKFILSQNVYKIQKIFYI
jgi:hypothetical protein